MLSIALRISCLHLVAPCAPKSRKDSQNAGKKSRTELVEVSIRPKKTRNYVQILRNYVQILKRVRRNFPPSPPAIPQNCDYTLNMYEAPPMYN
jgi:hypothetical protein